MDDADGRSADPVLALSVHGGASSDG
jgi:hypothetical protein